MDALFTTLAAMPFWAWFVLGGLLLLGEMLTGTTFLLWPAVAAGIMGIVTTTFLGGDWAYQWLLFAGLTVLLGIVGKPYAEKWINGPKSDSPHLNETEGRIGQLATVTMGFEDGRGRVRLGDSEWSAVGPSGLVPGTTVRVEALEGVTLTVAPVA